MVEQITLFQFVMSNMKLLNIPVKWFYDTDHTEVSSKNKASKIVISFHKLVSCKKLLNRYIEKQIILTESNY